MVVVILGIAGAQLTAILERRREFAVLIALGMKTSQVIRLILFEAATMAIMGGVAGLLLAFPLVRHTATEGVDFGSMMGGDLSMSGVLFDPIMYADMGAWMIPYGFITSSIAMFFAAVYPAWFALRTDPTSALSLREA
jgi:ABC-type antimicrobial peptide transport system permease subunit